MSSLSEHERRKVISDLFDSGKFANANQLYNYIKVIGVSRTSVWNIWNRLKSGLGIERAKGSGRKMTKLDGRKINSIIKFVSEKGTKPAKIASKYNVSRQHVSNIVKKSDLNFYKKIDAPKSTPAQRQRQAERFRELSNGVFKVGGKKHIIYDDESYFTFNNCHISSNQGYYATQRGKDDENMVYLSREKFGKKICIWIAISRKGHSCPFFIPTNCALNAETYSKHCIRDRLHKFIQENYPKNRYIFWPDGASCHYAKHTISTFEELGINFIRKDQNPPNIPQCRPIERFWAHLKQKVYADGWSADNYHQLKSRILSKLKNFDQTYFENLRSGDRERIHKASVHGVLSVIN